jgi:uncharacterized paraquat-inducible protein A
MARMNRSQAKRRGKKSKRLLLYYSNVLLSKMLPEDYHVQHGARLLDRASVAKLMAVNEFSKLFVYVICCTNHGTRLEQVSMIYHLVPKSNAQTAENAKIGKIRCGNCDDLSDQDEFGICDVCESRSAMILLL